MKPDPLTLNAQLVILQQDAKKIQDSATALSNQIEELKIQLERHRGALAYNINLTEMLNKQIAAANVVSTE